MSVIPFNPGRAAGAERAARRVPADGPDDSGSTLPVPKGTSSTAVPRTGDREADRLEHALIAALRENARNWARAERAEHMLARGRLEHAVAAERENH